MEDIIKFMVCFDNNKTFTLISDVDISYSTLCERIERCKKSGFMFNVKTPWGQKVSVMADRILYIAEINDEK